MDFSIHDGLEHCAERGCGDAALGRALHMRDQKMGRVEGAGSMDINAMPAPIRIGCGDRCPAISHWGSIILERTKSETRKGSSVNSEVSISPVSPYFCIESSKRPANHSLAKGEIHNPIYQCIQSTGSLPPAFLGSSCRLLQPALLAHGSGSDACEISRRLVLQSGFESLCS
jgi:hypothetical protein